MCTACSLTCCAWPVGLTSCSSLRVQRVEDTDPLRIFVHVAVLLRSALAEGSSSPSGFTRVWMRACSTSSSYSGKRPVCVDATGRRVVRFGLWGVPPPKLLEQSSAAALLLFCSGSHCYGRVPHCQWALLDADMLVLIDRSARLVEPCTCDRCIKCSRLAVRSRLLS